MARATRVGVGARLGRGTLRCGCGGCGDVAAREDSAERAGAEIIIDEQTIPWGRTAITHVADSLHAYNCTSPDECNEHALVSCDCPRMDRPAGWAELPHLDMVAVVVGPSSPPHRAKSAMHPYRMLPRQHTGPYVYGVLD